MEIVCSINENQCPTSQTGHLYGRQISKQRSAYIKGMDEKLFFNYTEVFKKKYHGFVSMG